MLLGVQSIHFPQSQQEEDENTRESKIPLSLPIMTNKIDQTCSNASIDDDASETIKTGLNHKKSSEEDAVEYPSPAQAALVMLALLLALFLTAIVRTNQLANQIHNPTTS